MRTKQSVELKSKLYSRMLDKKDTILYPSDFWKCGSLQWIYQPDGIQLKITEPLLLMQGHGPKQIFTVAYF